MKKMSKSAWKRSLRSRLKRAFLQKKYWSPQLVKFASKYAKGKTVAGIYSVSKPNGLYVTEMTRCDIKMLRRLGYKVQILTEISISSERLAYSRIIKGTAGIVAKGRIKSFAEIECCLPKGSSANYGFGGDSDGDSSNFGGGSDDFIGSVGGDSLPQNCTSEKKLLVMILENDEKRRKELEKILAGLNAQDTRIRERLRKITRNESQNGIEPILKKKVFRRDIKDSMMADAMYEVYERVFGDKTKAKNANCDFSPIDLIAYLFIMVDLHGYGRADFHTNGKRPFFEFFIEKIRPELAEMRGITRETMGNRINKEFDCLYLTSEAKEKQTAKTRSLNKRIEDNYQTVCGIFHKTRLGGILQKHK